MHSIAIANQKGGVGKTTSAINIAACLARLNHPTLLIDLDPQANATSGLGLAKSSGHSVYSALLGESDLTIQIEATAYDNLHLIPSELDLAGAEIELASGTDVVRRFARVLQPIREQCDYEIVVIDCPPSLGVLTMNAMAAADRLVIPIQCEYYALEGLSVITRVIERLRDGGHNPDLNILGILMTMYTRRTNLARQVVEEVQSHFGDLVFPTRIPRTVRLGEAPSHGLPIFDYDASSPAADAYRRVTLEIVKRLGMGDGAARDPPPPPAQPGAEDEPQTGGAESKTA
jgi:chromosome partitioning protein